MTEAARSGAGETINAPISGPSLDTRALRMVEMLANGRYASPRALQQLRLTLLVWVIRNKVSENLKRCFDLVGAGCLLVLVSPLMLATVIAIRLESPGPVIFRQKRVGKWGKPFECYKFRSMFDNAEDHKAALTALNEADEVVFKMKRDPRVTRVGHVIRTLSLDELPQLVNVIKGDMSLVGPRPPVPIEVDHYTFEHMQRLDAAPGITGLQQVSGRSDLSFRRWIELDLQYINEQSLLTDVQILLKTIPAVVSGRGAY